MVLLALVLAASPIPNDSRQLVLSVAVGWDARAAQVRLLEREDAGRPWRAVGERVLVGHNDAPRAAGGGSCIFLHLRDRKDATTAGCTAFDTDPLERLLRWLDPARRPLLVQLPASALRSVAADRGLPGSWP